MKVLKLITAGAVISCLTATVAFADPAVSSPSKDDATRLKGYSMKKGLMEFKADGFAAKKSGKMQIDPEKMLESKKERVQSMLKDGKIDQEKANEIIDGIDLKLKEIQEFNSLTLEQKKAKLLGDLKTSLDQRVADGKLTQEKADECLKNYAEKLETWDGSGYPGFHGRGFKGNKDGFGNKFKLKQ